MDPVTLIIAVLATARLTRLITDDKITEAARSRVARRGQMIAYLIHCPWCISIYTGAAVAASWWAWGGQTWHTAAMLALAASHATGVIASRTGD